MSTELNALDLTAPKVLEAYGADGKRLNFNDVYNSTHVNVQVPHYVGMLGGQTVRVRWTNGRYKYDTETLTVSIPGKLNFRIPRLEVIDSIGSLVTANYSVRLSLDAPLLISKALSLSIDPQIFDLSEPRLSADRKNVTVKFLNMASGYTVRVRWHGVVVRDTESQPIQNSSSMAFSIPANWITENAGKIVSINYSLHRSGSNDNLMFSRVLRVML
ncbi:hypothetical protein HU724_008550 [Pseudomonas iranensis]|uniref:hypothetical protein n=1 Tax=Pseudomonas iranensis TaxID=2745503 RepID=UPI0016457F2F|nr:hypothetical protein [Pseudomonas iranensis]QXI24316.1 hypothetical protein HU724_008550 [Pseudomonas iranensis]